MATNVVIFGASPRVPVDACAASHGSGDLVYESGKFGIAVETNASGQPNTLIQRGTVLLPVPSSGVVPGTKIYAAGSGGSGAFVAGDTLQAAPARASSVSTTLATSSGSNVLIGTAVTPGYPDGLSTVAKIELSPQ